MKKIIASFVLMSAVLTGCASNSSMSCTFNVETGDSIRVELDTSGSDYKLKADGSRFIINEEDTDVITGIFLTADMYDQYESAISETGTILESDGYILYEYAGESGTERNILLMVPDSETGIIMGSLADEETVRDIYGRLSFTNEK
jgi:hypothetical protein